MTFVDKDYFQGLRECPWKRETNHHQPRFLSQHRAIFLHESISVEKKSHLGEHEEPKD